LKLGFSEALAAPYVSGTQRARAWTEGWVASEAFCPSCGRPSLRPFRNNEPGRDFYCTHCQEDYQLKSTKGPLRRKLTDGAYPTLAAQIAASGHANFLFLRYDSERRSVTDLLAVPKQFISLSSIERRRPLGPKARRAGWTGANILLDQIPSTGRVYIVESSLVRPESDVVSDWARTSFLRDASSSQRGWLIDVMLCVEEIGRPEFTLGDVYTFEPKLALIYPENRNVRPKIRQQLQVLRDSGYLIFLGQGRYRLSR
jgi:type II restriction enzyme